ncbi:hypothetical protein AAFF_G00423490 [Aldrovandia affinis]|uniref:Uncharacterized protein n=1 Tax=Aldrovandia affinis TaxID=143900 RepID=A0AAD7T6N7_9TELE|nr:hypothetical protein AAFF_G00423490 [Aldrovandia affinis]
MKQTNMLPMSLLSHGDYGGQRSGWDFDSNRVQADISDEAPVFPISTQGREHQGEDFSGIPRGSADVILWLNGIQRIFAPGQMLLRPSCPAWEWGGNSSPLSLDSYHDDMKASKARGDEIRNRFFDSRQCLEEAEPHRKRPRVRIERKWNSCGRKQGRQPHPRPLRSRFVIEGEGRGGAIQGSLDQTWVHGNKVVIARSPCRPLEAKPSNTASHGERQGGKNKSARGRGNGVKGMGPRDLTFLRQNTPPSRPTA